MSAKDIAKNLRNVIDNEWNDTVEIFRDIMIEAETSAHDRAPWQDRTTIARESIEGFVIADKNKATGILGIGVWYGKFLELANGGKYRIIRPTLFTVRKILNPTIKNRLKLRK